MKTPCTTGFNCPYWSHDEDGMDLCTAPEVTERGGIEGKKGRYNLYPYVVSLDICPIVVDYSPIDEWLKSLKKDVNE